jgi:hypothetical protein
MKDSYYVVFNEERIDRFLRSDKFTLNSGEYAVRMEFEVPQEVFAPVHIPTTKVVIPADAVRRTIDIEVQVSE